MSFSTFHICTHILQFFFHIFRVLWFNFVPFGSFFTSWFVLGDYNGIVFIPRILIHFGVFQTVILAFFMLWLNFVWLSKLLLLLGFTLVLVLVHCISHIWHHLCPSKNSFVYNSTIFIPCIFVHFEGFSSWEFSFPWVVNKCCTGFEATIATWNHNSFGKVHLF